MEVERLFVQEFAEEQHELTSRPDILEVNPPEGQPPASQESRKSRKKIKPKYVLDDCTSLCDLTDINLHIFCSAGASYQTIFWISGM